MITEYNHPAVILWRAIELKTINGVVKKEKIRFKHPILDLGCGEGKIAKVLFGRQVVDYGLDNCLEMVESAKKSGVYKRVVLGDACQLPFKDQTMMAVFSNCVVEHIPNIDRVLSETSRVLKKDGLFLFTVPSPNFSTNLSFYRIFNFFGLRSLAEKYSNFRNHRLNHYNCFYLQEWRKRLKANNLRIECHRFYISHKTLFFWDFCALIVFPFTFLARIFKVERPFFPIKHIILKNLLTQFYNEKIDGENGAALLLLARKM